MRCWGPAKQPQNGGLYYQDLRHQRHGQQTSFWGNVCQGERGSGPRASVRVSCLPPLPILLAPWAGLECTWKWKELALSNRAIPLLGCLPCTHLREQVGVQKKFRKFCAVCGKPFTECGNLTVEGESCEVSSAALHSSEPRVAPDDCLIRVLKDSVLRLLKQLHEGGCWPQFQEVVQGPQHSNWLRQYISPLKVQQFSRRLIR